MNDTPRRVALVTGSATGIGRACAVRFAEQQFDVVVNYSRSDDEARETVDMVEETGATAILMQCDVRNDAAVREMMAAIDAQFGRLDVLVNNAAMTHFVDLTDLEAMTEEKWDDILAVNVKGLFFCSRAAASLLRTGAEATQRPSAIVNISSRAGILGQGSSIAYCASKGAVNTLTKSLARAFAPNIIVNAVCPGPVQSRWLKEQLTADQIEDLAGDALIPRASQPDDIADTVLYLATGTTLQSGQLLIVDGGATIV